MDSLQSYAARLLLDSGLQMTCFSANVNARPTPFHYEVMMAVRRNRLTPSLVRPIYSLD